MTNLDSTLIRNVVNYFIDNESTLRETAKVFGISRTAVHKCLTVYMPTPEARRILDTNKAEAPSRAGKAPKKKRSQ